jgi:hypothetical protein
MKATIHCERCNVELASVEAPTLEAIGQPLATMLLACHAAIPHTSHRMSVRWNDDDEPPRLELGATLTVECLHEHCGYPRVTTWDDVPLALVAAYTIAFHTAHEGHRIRVRHGARVWESPQVEVPQ